MTSFYRSIIFTLILLAALHPARSQSFSNAGKEFWIPFSYHFAMNPGIGGESVSMSIYVTSNVNTSFSVEIYGLTDLQPKRPITAGETVKIDIPTPSNFYLDGEKTFSNRIFRVLADDPVIVYSYISRGAQSAATVCLPVQVLGKEYYSMNFTQKSNDNYSHSYFTIIAVEDGITEVEITPSANTSTGKPAGVAFKVPLSKGQAYQVLGSIDANKDLNGIYNGVDLTGSKITSISTGANTCKRIAVYSGSGKVTIGSGCTGTSDNLFQQLYPLNSWGSTFLAIPSYKRPFNFYRIIAKDPSTTVAINGGGSVPLQQMGSVYTYTFPASNTPVKIESTGGNICVAQYFTSAGCNGNINPYDPDMIILNSVDQNIKEVNLVNARLLASEQNPFPATGTTPHEHHLHVIMKNQGTALSSFKYDGQSVPVNLWKPHPQDGAYSYLYIDDFKTVTQGYHNLASDSGFNALAYGYARNESYGYSAGANVRDKYQYLSIKNDSATIQKLKTCNGRPFFFEITVPYKINMLGWSFENNVLPLGSITSPQYIDSQKIDNKDLFTYQIPSPFVKASPGNYLLKLKMEINNPNGCSGAEESEFEFEVKERPKADFKNFKNCVSDLIEFADASNGQGAFLVKQFWELGDGNLATGDKVSHQYASANTYTVKHWVVNDIGCLSDTAVLTKVVDPLPKAQIAFTDAICEKRVLPVVDNSIPNTTEISNYKWLISPVGLVSNDTNPSFILDMGTYEIKHIVVNDKGCIDSVKQTVTVNEVPKTNFRAPKACLDDPTASFTNLTPYFSPGKIFNFLWYFGDPGSLDNTSTNENPFHRYNTKGDKEALLTVTDPVTGCDSTKAIKFTINGVNPKAAFDILSLCSNKEVILKNMSRVVDGGQVVKVELYWEPLQDTTDDEPKVGSLYQYKYPLVTMPNPTTAYNIRYIAYSGLTCRDILDTTISILASPLVQFDPLRSICQEKVDTLITATETTTINGTGVFSGTGVTTLSSTSAEFQPGAAGPGKHKISYTFSADNGCVDTASRIITVNPTPTKVSAGGDATGKVYMLEEDSVVLKGKASGQGLTYLWVPAAYMNNNKLDTPKVSPTDDQVYTFTATTDSGCKASSSVTVVVLKKIIVPNAFTPNGDGINDYWMITPLNIYPDATVQVYTRYGQLVFESRGYGSAWDGTYNGKPLPIATYYWVIDPKRRKPINGTVSIIR